MKQRDATQHDGQHGKDAERIERDKSERKPLLRLLKKLGCGAAELVAHESNGTDEATI